MSMRIPTGALTANTQVMKLLTHDVANANSTGFKESYGYFQSMVAGNGDVFSGGGVSATGVQNVAGRGELQLSSIGTNMAISGSGFFVTSLNATTKDIQYTRAGHFTPDNKGNLCNASGLYLQGWETNDSGKVPNSTNTNNVASLVTMNINNATGKPKATENLALGFMLPSTALVDETHTSSTSIYDSLGAKHDILLSWKKTIPNPATWELSISCASGNIYKNNAGFQGDLYGGADGFQTPMVVVFDDQGRPASYDGQPTPSGLFAVWDPLQTNAANTIVNLDLGTVGTLDGISSLNSDYELTRNLEDGKAVGQYRSVTIDDTGLISAVFSNGTTSPIGQIALANFIAPNQLEAQSGNAWIETQASGTYMLGKPKSSSFGKIVPSALEGSTVDLTAKLTDMIELQNHYSANTKSIAAYKKEFEDLMRII